MVSLFRMPPQSVHGGIVLAGQQAHQRLLHRPLPAAAHAHHLEHRAVHLDHALGRIARLLMQAVDVLRDQRVQLAAPLERDDGLVARVRLRLPRRMHQPRLPRLLAYRRIGHVIADVGELLRLRIARPHALRPATPGLHASNGLDAGHPAGRHVSDRHQHTRRNSDPSLRAILI